MLDSVRRRANRPESS